MRNALFCFFLAAISVYFFKRKRTKKLVSVSEVNDFIDSQLNRNEDVNWQEASANILFSAVSHAEGLITVGYGEKNTFAIDSGFQKAKTNLLQHVLKVSPINYDSIIVHDYGVIHALDVKISSFDQIERLLASEYVRYLDPVGYNSFFKPDSFGCDKNDLEINKDDYRVLSPSSWVPWNFDVHNISSAWKQSTGEDIGIGMIDTGISEFQDLLGENFNSGDSSGRRVEMHGTFDKHKSDQCGHGTMMASVMCSPRNDREMPMGVAYGSNLISYRGTGDVFLDGSNERRGVTEALKQLAERPDVRIISMSIGYMWSIGSIADAIKYACSKNKLIVAAGGTSSGGTSWYPVIFPANMKETVAVTGVNENGDKCSNCHSGKEIDFTIVMERNEDASRVVPVLGFNKGDRSYNGGSSIATAAAAGIAALVWSRNPEQSNKEVYEKLKISSQFYPQRNEYFGYGMIDALKAVNAKTPQDPESS